MQGANTPADLKGWLYAALVAALGALTYTVYKSEQNNVHRHHRQMVSLNGHTVNAAGPAASALSRKDSFRLRQLGGRRADTVATTTTTMTTTQTTTYSTVHATPNGGYLMYPGGAAAGAYENAEDPETYSAKRKDKLISAASEHQDLLAPVKARHQMETANEMAAVNSGHGASSKTSVGADSNMFYDFLQIYTGVQRVATEDGAGAGAGAGAGDEHDGSLVVAGPQSRASGADHTAVTHPYYQCYQHHAGPGAADGAAAPHPYASPASAYAPPPPTNSARSPYNYAESEHWTQRRATAATQSPRGQRSTARAYQRREQQRQAAADQHAGGAAAAAGGSNGKQTAPPSPPRTLKPLLPTASPATTQRRFQEAPFSPPSPSAPAPTVRLSGGTSARLPSRVSPKSTLRDPLGAASSGAASSSAAGAGAGAFGDALPVTARPLTATPSTRFAVPVAVPKDFSFHSLVDQTASRATGSSAGASMYARRMKPNAAAASSDYESSRFAARENDDEDTDDIERILHGDRLIRDRHRPTNAVYRPSEREYDAYARTTSLPRGSGVARHQRLASYEQQKDSAKPAPWAAGRAAAVSGRSSDHKHSAAAAVAAPAATASRRVASAADLDATDEYVPVGDVDSRSNSPVPAAAAAGAHGVAGDVTALPYDDDGATDLPPAVAALAAGHVGADHNDDDAADGSAAAAAAAAVASVNATGTVAPNAAERPDLASHLSGRNDLFTIRQQPRLTK